MIDLKTTPTEKLRERIVWLDKLRARSRGLALANATFYRELVAELQRRGELNRVDVILDDIEAPAPITMSHPTAADLKQAQANMREFMKWFTKTWKL